MLIETKQEPKFYKYFRQSDFKPSPQLLQTIRTQLNNAILKNPLVNPFTSRDLPPYPSHELPSVIFFMAKQNQDTSYRNLSFSYLDPFVSTHREDLILLLSTHDFTCEVFCLTLNRYLQEYIKANQLTMLVQKIKQSVIVDLLLSVLQKIDDNQKNQKRQSRSVIRKSYPSLVQALIGYASAKYIKQTNEDDFKDERFIERAVRISALAIDYAQHPIQFGSIRQFVHLTSHLLIFDKYPLKPVNMYDFCFSQFVSLSLSEEKHQQIIDQECTKKYFYFMGLFIKLDPEYLSTVVHMVKILLKSQIKSEMLIIHFQVLILIVREKIFPELKKRIYSILLENTDKKIQEFVDKIYEELLASDSEITNAETQCFNLQLAQLGTEQRKIKFVQMYYYSFTKNKKKLASDTINFIIQVYLQGKLDLPQFEQFINKEATHIKISAMKKLHSMIRQEKQETHIRFLEVVLRKRIDSTLKRPKEYVEAHPFVHRQWLSAAGDCPRVYLVYLKLIIETVGAKSIEIKPKLINLNSCIIKIQRGVFESTVDYYKIILDQAHKYRVYNPKMMRYMIVCQALFGHRLDIQSYTYFYIHFKETTTQEVDQLIFLLEYLVRVLKNKSSVTLYLQAILQFQKCQKDYYQRKIYQIQFLASLVEDSKYFEISSYSMESLTLLIQLWILIPDKTFEINAKKIIRKWSQQMSTAECNNLCYLFCFRQIKKIFPFLNQKQQKNNKERIQRISDLLLELLDIQSSIQEHLQTINNRISIEWKLQNLLRQQEKSIKLEMDLLRNVNMNLVFQVQVHTAHKIYIIEFSNDRCFVFAKTGTNQAKLLLKEFNVKQLKKTVENVHLTITLQSLPKNKFPQFHLAVVIMGQPIQVIEDGSIQFLQFECSSPAFLSSLIITNLTLGEQLKKMDNHLYLMKNIEVRIKSLPTAQLMPFHQKIDFQRVYCIWGEMLKYFKLCHPIEGYNMFVRLSFRLFKHLSSTKPHRKIPNEITVMRGVFNLLQKGFQTIRSKAQVSIQIQLKEPLNYGYYLYHLYVSAFLPKDFWYLFSEDTKKCLIKLLSTILKNEQFSELQNQNFELFEQLCQLVDEQEGVIDILEDIILTHQVNTFLTLKFQHYICLTPEKRIVAQRLPKLLEILVDCISSQNEGCLKNKIMCKFLITETNIIDVIFSFCPSKSKVTLIKYIMYSTNLVHKIRDLVTMMKSEEKNQLMGLIVIQLQQDSVPKVIKRRLSNNAPQKSFIMDKNQQALYTPLYLMTKLWSDAEKDIIEDAANMLIRFLSLQAKDIKSSDSTHIQIQNVICTEPYSDFLFNLKRVDRQELIQYQEDFDLIFEISFKIISQGPKKKFITFMMNYLKKASLNLNIALHPLKSSHFSQIPICNQVVILQYIFQLLVLMKHDYIFQQEKKMLVEAIVNYVESFIINIRHNNELDQPLAYVFPKLMGNMEQLSQKQLAKKFKKIENVHILELKGGIYFKLILIVIHLLHVNITTDFTKIIDLLLFKKKRRNTLRQSLEFIQSQKTPFEKELIEVGERHKNYFKQKEEVNSKDSGESQVDLSPYLHDFFMMRLCDFLQNYADMMNEDILESYSSIVLQQLQYPSILKQITDSNQFIYSGLQNYDDILNLIQVSMISPLSNNQDRRSNVGQYHSPQAKTFKQQINDQFGFNTSQVSPHNQSPQKNIHRASFRFEQQVKRRNQIIEELSKDPSQWAKIAKKYNFSMFFSSKSKEIRINQLIHTHFVLNRQKNEPSTRFSHNTELSKLITKHFKTCKILTHRVDPAVLECSLKKVKKIYPYTSPTRTVLKVMENCFKNMACPITQQVSCKDYSLKKLRHQESLNVKHYQQQELSQEGYDFRIESAFRDCISQVEIFEDQFQESADQLKQEKQYCQFVTREGVYFCEWELSERELKLKPKESRPSYKDNKIFIYGTQDDNLLKKNLTQYLIDLTQIQEIFYRKFSQMYNSIEMFMNNGTSKFICFYTKKILGFFMKFLDQVYKGLKIVRDPTKQFNQLSYTDRWVDGTLSNFDYLMLLNKYSGRTHNDVNQYYIFPWVLKDFRQDRIDLTDSQFYRDLSKPMGALNPQKLKRFKDIYKGNMGTHFFGSHYSTSLFILYYLVRLEPFTTLHRDMQQGFDLADRLFSSIQQVWDTLMCQSSTSDIKELIPEFYYMPSFLKNVGNIEFGQKMGGQEVNDVILPPWASSAEEFILTQRAALQSDYVSENLHLWIDLIFGRHQCSEQKFNVFLPTTYQDKLQQRWRDLMKNPEELKATIDQITYFGQCPTKLFNKEHKPKKLISQSSRPHKSSINKKALSHTTTSQVTQEEAHISPGVKLTNIFSDTYKFYLEFQNSRNQLTEVVIQSSASFQEIKLSLEDPKAISKSKSQSSRLRVQGELFKLDKTQLKAGSQIIMSLQMNFSFQHVKMNDMWIVCYGREGLRVYNWLQTLHWKWEKEEVTFVQVQPTRIIFATPSGKVCFYSFFNGRFEEILAIKDCSFMQVKVIAIPRLPCRFNRNQIQYRILCVGDGKKVTLVSYYFQQNLNQTSRVKLIQ